MIKAIFLTSGFFFLFALLQAQTVGQLEVTISTSDAGGNYKPKNVLAVWVEDAQGNFIKTLLARADKRKTHLNTWQASTSAAGTEYNTVDAITGATLSSHGTRSCSWNGRDYNGTNVPDGNYLLRLELTDKNATGHFSSFNFEKGPTGQSWTPSDVPSFSGIQIQWTPDQPSDVVQTDHEIPLRLSPNPVSQQLGFSAKPNGPYRIFSHSGQLVYRGSEQILDVSSLPAGVYVVLFEKEGNSLRFVKQ